MKKQIALRSLVIFFFFPPFAFSQSKSETFTLSISVAQTTFHLSDEVKVRGKLENKSGHTASFDGGRLELSRHGKEMGCIYGECFDANFPFPKGKNLKSGAAVEFEVNLRNLYWVDLLSSVIDFAEPKNMSSAIKQGYYSLAMYLSVPHVNSAEENPRPATLQSNEVSVKFAPFLGS